MENSQLISIIIPVYNVEEYIEKCIRSIMNQTYPSLEIIIVDDGSSDNSGRICDCMEEEDSRIKVVHQSNKGLVRARKNGLKIAKGELIGFVDGDDYIEPYMYERLCQLQTEHDADIVHSGFFYNETQKMEGVKKGGEICITEENRVQLLKKVLYGRDKDFLVTPSIWSKLFKRDLVTQSYNTIADSSSFGEDLFCLCDCFMSNIKIIVAAEAYYHYTIRNKSLSHDEGVAMIVKLGGLHNVLHEIFARYGIWDCLKESVDEYCLNGMIGVLAKREKGSLKKYIQVYQFPNIELLFGKRIILYGAGSVGCDYYTQIRKHVKCELTAWVDSHYGDYKCDYCELTDPQTIPDLKYDVILLGVMNRQSAEEIKHYLIRMGVPEGKICWKCPERISIFNR